MAAISPASKSTRKEFEEWQKKHATLSASKPADGRDYLRHARNLLPLLEGVAELHPFAKAIVVSFKAVIMFENDRKENDARVSSVFLSQANMMRVLLDLDNLAARRQQYFGDQYEPQDLHKELMDKIGLEITECGSCVDVYYKEPRVVKFCKSGEWKQKMMGYVESFSNFRIMLLQTLQIQVASGVDDLNAKMNVLLNHFFDTRHEWEDKLFAATQGRGSPARWTKDPRFLQRLITLSNEHSINNSVFDPKGSPLSRSSTMVDTDNGTVDWNQSFIKSIRDEIHTSLDVLCQENKDLFETKLHLHNQRMEDSIKQSTQTIIRALSGPYDRLKNEDLRLLWKEMSWIFCVDNKLFVMALYEYYLDMVSTYHRNHHTLEGQNEGDSDSGQAMLSPPPTGAPGTKTKRIQHPDAWTLEYISNSGDKLSSAIDVDDSGYIRISEANAFTDQMPTGWTLPQWCAYNAAGWYYEICIYQMRVNQVFMRMCELQSEILPTNRSFVFMQTARLIRLFFPLTRYINGSEFQNPPIELHDLVKDKIQKQDEEFKQALEMFDFVIQDQSTIDLIFSGKKLESYLLPFATLLLEYWLQLVELCTRETLDIREWEAVEGTSIHFRDAVIARIGEVTDQITTERGPDAVDDGISKFYGGLYSNFYREFFLQDDEASEIGYDDILAYRRNIALLEDFPLRPIEEECHPLHQLPSWEEYAEEHGEEREPPMGWGEGAEGANYSKDRTIIDFPYHQTYSCDGCGADQIIGRARFNCLECHDFDFCNACQEAETEVRDHKKSHPMLKMKLYVARPFSDWLSMLARYHKQTLVRELVEKLEDQNQNQDEEEGEANDDDGDENDDDDDATYPGPILPCHICGNEIDLTGTFYHCVGHSCQDVSICPRCVNTQAPEKRVGHQTWHCMIVLKDLDLTHFEEEDEEDEDEEGDKKKRVVIDPTVLSKIDNLEVRMKDLETKMDSGLAEIKALFEQIVVKLGSAPSGSRTKKMARSGAERSSKKLSLVAKILQSEEEDVEEGDADENEEDDGGDDDDVSIDSDDSVFEIED